MNGWLVLTIETQAQWRFSCVSSQLCKHTYIVNSTCKYLLYIWYLEVTFVSCVSYRLPLYTFTTALIFMLGYRPPLKVSRGQHTDFILSHFAPDDADDAMLAGSDLSEARAHRMMYQSYWAQMSWMMRKLWYINLGFCPGSWRWILYDEEKIGWKIGFSEALVDQSIS